MDFAKTYSNLYYSTATFNDISTNANIVANENTLTISSNEKLYWLILK